MTRRSVAALSTALLFLATGACRHAPVESVATTEVVPVGVEPARIDTLQATIDVTGMLQPASGADWTIVAPEAAQIAELPKAEGDVVKPGDLLVRFDIPRLTSEVATRGSELTAATARLDTAHSNTVRVTGLFDRGIMARKEVEDAKQRETEAAEDLKQVQTVDKIALDLAARATVKARFAGVVAKRWHNVGDYVDAASTDPVLRVIDPTRLEIVASVPVQALVHIVPGHAAHVVNPVTGADDAATVLTKPAAVDPSSATANVRLTFATPTTLSLGTTLTVHIVGDERRNVLIVPTAALTHNDDGEKVVMVAGADDKAHEQPVQTGLSTHDFTEITSGLKPGDQVIVRGLEGLPDGGRISIVK